MPLAVKTLLIITGRDCLKNVYLANIVSIDFVSHKNNPTRHTHNHTLGDLNTQQRALLINV